MGLSHTISVHPGTASSLPRALTTLGKCPFCDGYFPSGPKYLGLETSAQDLDLGIKMVGREAKLPEFKVLLCV